MSPQRQLAAIMFTDIVGYTAIMGKDEQGALDLLRQSRTIQQQAIERFNGKWLKEMGDGVLAQFNSAVDAVNCALQIQRKAVILNGKIRIGIHLGDVTIENADVFGDGVNIASRIQSIADPGGIYITESIHSAIRAQAGMKTRFLGEVALKNVAYPVKTYCLVEDFLPRPTPEKLRQLLHAPGKQKFRLLIIGLPVIILTTLLIFWWMKSNGNEPIRSLVVLPVENLTGNSEVDFYTEGILDAINNEIGKIRNLRVPSTRTSLSYKKSNLSISEITEELDVQGAVELSLFRVGDSVNIRVKLIGTEPEERQIWSREFIRDMPHILSLYGDVAIDLAKELKLPMSDEMSFQLVSHKEVIPQAYEAYLMGMSYWYKLSKQDLDQALRYFELAQEIDPNYAPAYTGIGMVWGARAQSGILPGKEVGPKLDSLMLKALALDSSLTEVHYSLAINNTWWKWDWQRAGIEFRKTIQLNPSHAAVRAYYSHYLNIVGRPAEAIPQIEKALEIDPFNPLFQALYGMDLNYARKFDQVIDVLTSTLKTAPNDLTALSTLRSAYHNNKEYDKAYEIFIRSYQVTEDEEAVLALELGYNEGGYSKALTSLAEMLIERSEIEYVTPWRIATLYTRAGYNDEAIRYLNLAYEDHDANMPYIDIDPIFDDLKGDSRFQVLLAKMDFPNSN